MTKKRRRVSVKVPLRDSDFLSWDITGSGLPRILISWGAAALFILKAEKQKYGPDLLRMIVENDARIEERTRLAHSLIVSSLHLIDSLAANKAEQAAMNMLEACSCDFNLYRDERKRSSSEGGKASKKKEGIGLAIREALKKSKLKKADDLWRYFQEKHEGEGNACEMGNYEIWFDRDKTGSGDDRLYQVDRRGITANITFTTFKRYVTEVKRSIPAPL